jgi:hypothetical protein
MAVPSASPFGMGPEGLWPNSLSSSGVDMFSN